MAYFSSETNGMERGGKVAADIFVALLILAFSIAFFGVLGGLAAFIVMEVMLLGVDNLMPDEKSAGAAVR